MTHRRSHSYQATVFLRFSFLFRSKFRMYRDLKCNLFGTVAEAIVAYSL